MEKENKKDIKEKELCELCAKNKGTYLVNETHFICEKCKRTWKPMKNQHF